MKVSAVVFEHCGNRFLVPGFWWSDKDRPCGWSVDAMMWGMFLGIKHEPTLFELDADESGNFEIPCVKADMTSRELKHGGTTVYMISGPVFDEAVAKA